MCPDCQIVLEEGKAANKTHKIPDTTKLVAGR